MKRFSLLCGLLLLIEVFSVSATQTLVKGMRIWSAPDHTRLVLDTTGPVEHQVLTLHGPERLVIDVRQARLGAQLPLIPASARFIQSIRTGPRGDQDLRMVLDLKQSAHIKSFLLTPNALYGHRLVVDLEEPATPAVAAPAVKPPHVIKSRLAKAKLRPPRDLVVAVDAGHGGDDPGAVGPNGIFEKDVVLGIARRLARRINAEPGMRAILTRKGDYYLGLRRRVNKARRMHSDLFISIHADSFPDDRRVCGSSVFTLSERGASNEAARWLAEKENAADLVGGVALDNKDDLLATMLLDMSMSATMEASRLAAESVLQQLGRVGRVHKKKVQYAGFAVLKAPDIPGLLVETAYISNPREEAKLRDPKQQERIARALFLGVRNYFYAHPPVGTRLAETNPRRHVVTRGDTLSAVAQHYRVTLDDLRHANDLAGDRVLVGQILTIPES